MNIRKIIGYLLLITGIWASIHGIKIISDNTHVVELMGMVIDDSSEAGQTRGFMYLGFGVVGTLVALVLIFKNPEKK